MALTVNYFQAELLIPGIVGTTYAETENLALLNRMIKKYEPLFLEQLLGADLADAFIAAMALSPTSGVWFDLNAQIYQVDTSSPATYISPVANYVYFKFWKVNITATQRMGETKPTAENATMVSNGPKMVDAWNEMVRMIGVIRTFLDDHSADYTLWGSEEITEFETINQWGL